MQLLLKDTWGIISAFFTNNYETMIVLIIPAIVTGIILMVIKHKFAKRQDGENKVGTNNGVGTEAKDLKRKLPTITKESISRRRLYERLLEYLKNVVVLFFAFQLLYSIKMNLLKDVSFWVMFGFLTGITALYCLGNLIWIIFSGSEWNLRLRFKLLRYKIRRTQAIIVFGTGFICLHVYTTLLKDIKGLLNSDLKILVNAAVYLCLFIVLEYLLVQYYRTCITYFKNEKAGKRSINNYLASIIRKSFRKEEFRKDSLCRLTGHANMSVFNIPCMQMFKTLIDRRISFKILMLNPLSKEMMSKLGDRESKDIKEIFQYFPVDLYPKELHNLLIKLISATDLRFWPQTIILLSLSYWITLRRRAKEASGLGEVDIRITTNPQNIKAFVIGKKRAYIGHYYGPNSIGFLNSMVKVTHGTEYFVQYLDELWDDCENENNFNELIATCDDKSLTELFKELENFVSDSKGFYSAINDEVKEEILEIIHHNFFRPIEKKVKKPLMSFLKKK